MVLILPDSVLSHCHSDYQARILNNLSVISNTFQDFGLLHCWASVIRFINFLAPLWQDCPVDNTFLTKLQENGSQFDLHYTSWNFFTTWHFWNFQNSRTFHIGVSYLRGIVFLSLLIIFQLSMLFLDCERTKIEDEGQQLSCSQPCHMYHCPLHICNALKWTLKIQNVAS